VFTQDRIGGITEITDQDGSNIVGSANLSADSSWYVAYTENAQADTQARSYDYEIRFSSTTTVAYSWGVAGSTAKYSVPFSVWNTTTQTPVAFEIRDLNVNNQWEEGEAIYITRVPYPSPAPAMGAANPATNIKEFAYQILITNAPVDTSKRLPVTSTVIRIVSNNALTEQDSYEFSFTAASFDAGGVDLSEVRVVPNPYIVTSGYESQQNVRQIRFMYLPPECSITVFTVSGTRVKTLQHNSTNGSLSWNLVTDWGQALAFGVYVYVVEDPLGNRHIGKFALIK
jgi:hypothetical protein